MKLISILFLLTTTFIIQLPCRSNETATEAGDRAYEAYQQQFDKCSSLRDEHDPYASASPSKIHMCIHKGIIHLIHSERYYHAACERGNRDSCKNEKQISLLVRHYFKMGY
jgi:hypothetical protein